MERGTDLPSQVQTGDILLGLTSDGIHSNGYSLVRKLVALSGLNWSDPSPFSDGTLAEALLTPTRLYVKPALDAVRAGGVHALAHITGGGLTENIPRVLPRGAPDRAQALAAGLAAAGETALNIGTVTATGEVRYTGTLA